MHAHAAIRAGGLSQIWRTSAAHHPTEDTVSWAKCLGPCRGPCDPPKDPRHLSDRCVTGLSGIPKVLFVTRR